VISTVTPRTETVDEAPKPVPVTTTLVPPRAEMRAGEMVLISSGS